MDEKIFDVKPKLLIPYILFCSIGVYILVMICLVISLPVSSFLIFTILSDIKKEYIKKKDNPISIWLRNLSLVTF